MTQTCNFGQRVLANPRLKFPPLVKQLRTLAASRSVGDVEAQDEWGAAGAETSGTAEEAVRRGTGSNTKRDVHRPPLSRLE